MRFVVAHSPRVQCATPDCSLDKGADELTTAWSDPNDTEQRAFHYSPLAGNPGQPLERLRRNEVEICLPEESSDQDLRTGVVVAHLVCAMMRSLLREPLLHFFILGVLLFALYGWLHEGVLKAPNEIVVSRGQLLNLQEQFQRVWHRPPTPEELQGLVDGWVREEILYREGLAMGLDRDDQVVRRRIGQKLEFIAEGAAPKSPTNAELQAWLDAHPDKYLIEPTYSLRQIYFDPTRRGSRLEVDAAAARRALESGKKVVGDSTMLPDTLDGVSAFEVGRVFGTEFADSLKALPVGGWQGPIRSGFGLHLVELSARDAGRPAALEDVRAAVERDLLQARSKEASAAAYRKLRANYSVRIEDGATTPAPSG